MIPGAMDIMVAYPDKDHTIAREVDISAYMGDGCWFSCGRTADLVDETKGFWMCKAVPHDSGDNDMAMHIVFFSDLEDAGSALDKLDVLSNSIVMDSFLFMTGVDIDA